MADLIVMDQSGKIVMVSIPSKVEASRTIQNLEHPEPFVMSQTELKSVIFDLMQKEHKTDLVISYNMIIYWDPVDDNTYKSKGCCKTFVYPRDPIRLLGGYSSVILNISNL
jgi:hypothetical protein